MFYRMTVTALVVFIAMMGTHGARANEQQAAFEKIKKLAGTWVEADKDGKPTDKVVSVVKLTAGGSAVHETLFPGESMEMV